MSSAANDRSLVVAIHRDYLKYRDGREESYSARWAEVLEERGHAVKWVNAFEPDIVDQLAGADAFMWRFMHVKPQSYLGKIITRVAAENLGLSVFPDINTNWHYDDKVAQYYLLRAANIPTPNTWIFWSLEEAAEFCAQASYPLVLKLAAGAAAENVRLLRNAEEALSWAKRIFQYGIKNVQDFNIPMRERIKEAVSVVRKGPHSILAKPAHKWVEWHTGYFYVQEFLAGNAFDTRVTVIGERVFGIRRFNRPDDFRASGSGRIDFNPEAVDTRFIELAVKVADSLKVQSVAVDCLFGDGGTPLIGEISYACPVWLIRDCPGHWAIRRTDEGIQVAWQDGHMWPQDAMLEDFLAKCLTEQNGRKTA